MSEAVTLRPYISSKKIDNVFIIGSPILAFLAVAMFCEPRYKSGNFLQDPSKPQWFVFMAALLTYSHIMLVFLRSHLNTSIFTRFKFRFTLIPLVGLIGMWSSPLFFGIMGFVALYWDEWHSLMQTFGFGRIYDSKLGNDPNVGRKLDIGLCFVLGLLPHLILLTFIPTELRNEGLQAVLELDEDVAVKYGHFIYLLRWPFIVFGLGYVLFYIYHYKKIIRAGYKFSKTKLLLLLSTGVSTIIIASLYSVVEAAYFGNIYHALQYYFIVYISEGPRIKTKSKISGTTIFFVIFSFILVFGVMRNLTENEGLLGAFWLLTSLLHFWYDGFIWSVRKQDI